jgi:plastocyanin
MQDKAKKARLALCCIIKVFVVRGYHTIKKSNEVGYDMRCIHVREAYIRLIISHLRHSIILVFIFLVCSTRCYAYSFPATLATFSKGEIITIQINGSAQPPGFSPALLTLHVNDTVAFINHALPAKSYTLSADDGSFSSPPIPSGGQWTITFHTLGSHTYRDASSVSTMVGELIVVDKSIHLLPTPDPLVEATVMAYIKNRQNPPDTIIITTHKHATTSSSDSLIPMIILIVGISISTTLLSILGITFYRRHRQRMRNIDEDLDDEITLADDDTSNERIQQIRTIIDNARKKLQTFPPFKAGKLEDDDDNDNY